MFESIHISNVKGVIKYIDNFLEENLNYPDGNRILIYDELLYARYTTPTPELIA